MMELLVPVEQGPEIVIRYSGDDPRTYVVRSGRVEVEDRFVDQFLAAVPGATVPPAPEAEPAPRPAESAKPAPKEG